MVRCSQKRFKATGLDEGREGINIKRSLTLIVFLVIVAAVFAVGCGGSLPAPDMDPTSSAPPEEPEEDTTEVEIELSSGHYTAGVDIPAGTYNIEAIEGAGNVYTDSLVQGINALMGTEEANKTLGYDFYEQEYSNIRINEGTVLSIAGVKVRITSKNASGKPLKERNQDMSDSFTLKNGHFVAGEDFPAGVYDIIAEDGYGNVYSDNLIQGINAIMGTEDNELLKPERTFKNVLLKERTTLSVDGVTVKLVPSK